jgi:septal ring factor EnvC (AmiA/AmiB activator)
LTVVRNGNFFSAVQLSRRVFREDNLKILPFCLLVLLCATPVCAAQPLVLTEIEQLQEKIWYLQNDLAAQKLSIEKNQKQLSQLASGNDRKQQEQETLLASLTSQISSQQEKIAQSENTLSTMEQMLARLSDEVGQQRKLLDEQAEKTGNQERSIQALRTEVAKVQAQSETAAAETLGKLEAARIQIEAMGKDAGRSNEKLIWLGAGAALLLAIALTFGVALGNRKHSRRTNDYSPPADHEM